MEQWEYKLFTPRWRDGVAVQEAAINELGQQGWELVSAMMDNASVCYCFKRERRF